MAETMKPAEKKLLDIYKDDKEMLRLMLEIEQRTNENTTHYLTKVLLPCFIACLGVLSVGAAFGKIFL